MTFRHILAAAAITTAFAGAAFAADPSRDELVSACMANSNLPEPICGCVADKLLSDDYTETQRLWYVTSQSDTDAASGIAATMPPADTMAIGMFMATGPAQCAAGN